MPAEKPSLPSQLDVEGYPLADERPRVAAGRPLEAVLLGAGNRGFHTQGSYALRHPDRLRYVAVAEPNPTLRDRFGDAHGIPAERRYASWQDLLAAGRLAPALVNTTPDRVHFASTLGALETGYDVLLEKPMATSPAECVRIVETAERLGRIVMVNHGLRYAPFFALIKESLAAGKVGEVMHYSHFENVAFWHMAHSFVRGNWGSAEASGPMILTKCCHDLDLMCWYTGSRPRRVSSFGSLRHLRAEEAADAPERCTDGCPRAEECPYFAPRLYLSLDDPSKGFIRRAASVEGTPEAILAALKTGPYGRCVYRCGNDVVDSQKVLVEMEDGTVCSLTMQGFANVEGRYIRFDGTGGTLVADMIRDEVEVASHLDGRRETIRPGRVTGGHGGGDDRLLSAFVASLRAGQPDPLISARSALESHLLAFAAEESRTSGQTIDMREYRARYGATE